MGSSCSGGDSGDMPMPVVGCAVQANYEGEWYDGLVSEIHPEDNTVDFVSADAAFMTERLPLALLRLVDHFKVGDEVSVKYSDDCWYDGTIERVDPDTGDCDVVWPEEEEDGEPMRTPGLSMWMIRRRTDSPRAGEHPSSPPRAMSPSSPWSLGSPTGALPRRPLPPNAASPDSERLHAGKGQPDIWLRGPTPGTSPTPTPAPSAALSTPAHAG
eukprot:Hpha_TRINITY_DN34183_c0_g1::TRINITY_DN34183_c0_g1_i1::g.75898::m.75898